MKNLLLVVATLGMLAGCVTQSTYSGSNKPVVKTETDRSQAAMKRIELGLAYLKAGDPEQAKFNLERAREFEPKRPEVHSSLAYFYQQVGEFNKAKKSYLHAIDLDPTNAPILNNYGVFLCGQKEYAAAERYFLAAIDITSYTRVADAYENAGVCAADAGDTDKARSYFERALSYNALRPRALLALAELEYDADDLVASLTYLQRFHINRQPTAASSSLAYRIARARSDVRELVKYADILKKRFPDVYQVLQQEQANQHVQPVKQARIKLLKKPDAKPLVASNPTQGASLLSTDKLVVPTATQIILPDAEQTEPSAAIDQRQAIAVRENATIPELANMQTATRRQDVAVITRHSPDLQVQEQVADPFSPPPGVSHLQAGDLPVEPAFFETNWQELQMEMRIETQLQANYPLDSGQ